MSQYKIHYGPDGKVKGFGPNVDAFQPHLDEGDTLEYADALPGPSPDELYSRLRNVRDARLTATDKYLLADYPINAADLALVSAYRAALRALPDLPGAPWDGGGEATPWPTASEIMRTEPPCV